MLGFAGAWFTGAWGLCVVGVIYIFWVLGDRGADFLGDLGWLLVLLHRAFVGLMLLSGLGFVGFGA